MFPIIGEVVIRTNSASTILTIDAEHDTVAHYGEAGFLNIIKVNTASYHEHGYVPQAQIAQGRIVNEAGSVETEDGSTKKAGVENLFIVAATEGSGSTAGTFNEVIVEAAQGAEVPYLDRSDVNIVDAVLVVEVKTATTDDFVYLTKSGIVEQVVVTTEKGNTDTAGAKATTGNDSSLNATASKAADEIANIAKRGANGRPVKADGTTEMTVEEVAELSSVSEITIAEPKATKADLEKSQGENALFAGGAGTKNSPYMIYTEQQFCNISITEDEDTRSTNAIGNKTLYYKVYADLDFETREYITYDGGYGGLVHKVCNADIDMNGHKLVMSSDNPIFSFGTSLSFHDGDVYYQNTIGTWNVIVGYYFGYASFKNIDTYCIGDYTNCEASSLYVMDDGTDKNKPSHYYEFIDCDNHVNVQYTGTSGCFSIYLSKLQESNNVLYFDDCDNYGNIVGKRVAMFIGNLADGTTKNTVSVENCKNEGTFTSTTVEIKRNNGSTSYTFPNNPYIAYVEAGNKGNAANFYDNSSVVSINSKKLSEANTIIGSQNFIYRAPDKTFAIAKSDDNIVLTKATDTTITRYVVKSSVTVNYMNKKDVVGDHYSDQYGWSTFYMYDYIDASSFESNTLNIEIKNYQFYFKNKYVVSDSRNNFEAYNNGQKSSVTIDGTTYEIITIGGKNYYIVPEGYELESKQTVYPNEDLYVGNSSSNTQTPKIVVEAYAGDTLMYTINLK